MSDYLYPSAHPVMPYLVVTDPLAIADFYKKAFGLVEIERVNGEDGTPMHMGMGYDGKTIVMFSPQSLSSEEMRSPKSTGATVPITIFVYCADVDALFKQAVAAGAEALSQPEDMFWGDRVCRLRDPENYRWSFSTHTGKTFAP